MAPHERLVSAVAQLYELAVAAADHSDESSRTNRELAAAALAAGLARLEREATASGNETDDSDGFWLSDSWEEGDDQEQGASAGTSTGATSANAARKSHRHFTDILLSKLIERSLPSHIHDKDALTQRLNDPIRQETASLSLSTFVKNLRKLTERLGAIFHLQYSIVRILHWSHPSETLLTLVVYTLIVLHPNVLFIVPIVFLLCGVLIPGYLYRHPQHRQILHPCNERGDSLFNCFARVKDEKQLAKFFDEDDQERLPELDTVDSKYVFMKKNMEFLVNLRDLQNGLAKMVAIFDKLEKFWYGTAGFKDERVSTSLFFTLCLLVATFIVIGPYIPWRFLLIVNGWTTFVLIHPKVKPMVKDLKQLLKPRKQELDKLVKESERKDIIIDEPPEIRQVEIFEIWQKSHTTNDWEFYMFSPHVFHLQDSYRKSTAPPPGVTSIDEVSSPKSWRFDDDSWNIDYDCREWCQIRDVELIVAKQEIDQNNEFLVDDQFKRRRLFRDVIRYSRPARKPSRLL